MLTLRDAGVVEVPQLGTLLSRPPLAEAVAMRKHACLGAGFFFVTPSAADQCVETIRRNRFLERDGLIGVAAFQRMRKANGALDDQIVEVADEQ